MELVRTRMGWFVLLLWLVAAGAVIWLTYVYILRTPAPAPPFPGFPEVGSTGVVAAPGGHAYRYVAAPNITWDAARAAAAGMTHQGRRGYLATIGSEAEFRFVLDKVFRGARSDVTYLGGRQTARGEWRWVTGPEGAMDGGKGQLFWTGDQKGAAQNGLYANWMFTAFQHGGPWDAAKVCCVTLFSYRLPQFSTSLGTGEPDEGVAGYLVEFGG